MAKRKVDSVEPTHPIGIKKVKQSKPIRAMNSNLLDDESSNEDESPGVQLDQPDFKINEEYAKRFEFNKKREEKHKCEFLLGFRYLQDLSFHSRGEVREVGKACEGPVWR
jgi:protein KRI1